MSVQAKAWLSLLQGVWRVLPERLHSSRARFVVFVILQAILCALLAAILAPSTDARLLNLAFVGLLVLQLLAFLMGLTERWVTFICGGFGLVYLFAISLFEGHIYSSTLAWVPLIPLAVFYVIEPRIGRLWMLVGVLVQVAMAAVAWVWGPQLPPMNMPELPLLSLIDLLLATLALFLVPDYYQKQLETRLRESRQHQQDLRTQQTELEHTLQMREHFIASVSHELRTPMNAILGLNALLLERVQDKPQARKVLQYTRQSAEHLMTVINDVLDYSQFTSGKITPRIERFALRQTVRAAFELFLPRIESTRLAYECEIGPDVPEWVQTDRHRLMQVLVNLLGNAIKFTEQGRVRLQVKVVGDGVEFSVEDTGIGIAAQQQQTIFERFCQADASIQKRYGGSGLGLTISQRLVQMLGGQLQLHSHPGQGSRFWFRLPLQGVQAPAAPAAVQPLPVPAQAPAQRFLLVDDHPVNRLLVRQMLQRDWPHAQIQEAENGAQALRIIDASPAFDLVLMDMVMPVMDGIETTQAIRSNARDDVRRTPVLGLTANVSSGDLQRFEGAGLNGLLLKPFEAERLLAEVQRLTLGAQVQELTRHALTSHAADAGGRA